MCRLRSLDRIQSPRAECGWVRAQRPTGEGVVGGVVWDSSPVQVCSRRLLVDALCCDLAVLWYPGWGLGDGADEPMLYAYCLRDYCESLGDWYPLERV